MKRVKPGPGQESVWDYPRPPRIEPVNETIRIVFNNRTIVETQRAMRVLETSHPPVYYLPPGDVQLDCLQPSDRSSTFCEWKGMARYFDVVVDERRAEGAAWAYPQPTQTFESIRGFLAIYAEAMDACFVGDEQVQPQVGNFYGGWITSRVVGPFKGGAGTFGW